MQMTLEQLHNNRDYRSNKAFIANITKYIQLRLTDNSNNKQSEEEKIKVLEQIYAKYDELCLKYGKALQMLIWDADEKEFLISLLDSGNLARAYTNFVNGNSDEETNDVLELIAEYKADFGKPFLKMFLQHFKDGDFPPIVTLIRMNEWDGHPIQHPGWI